MADQQDHKHEYGHRHLLPSSRLQSPETKSSMTVRDCWREEAWVGRFQLAPRNPWAHGTHRSHTDLPEAHWPVGLMPQTRPCRLPPTNGFFQPVPEPKAATGQPEDNNKPTASSGASSKEYFTEIRLQFEYAHQLTQVAIDVRHFAPAMLVCVQFWPRGYFNFVYRGLLPPYKRRISRRQMDRCLKIECLH